MALEVDITKKLDGFFMHMQFRAEQEIFAILGASGCGKSMTLKCIAGIEKPDEGRIVLDGKVLFDSEKKINLPPQKRKVGYLFQNYALFPNMTVETNIAAGLSGKITAGDIITLLITDKNGETKIPPELKYLKVITTTTGDGTDADKAKANENGVKPTAAAVTVLCNSAQARLIAEYENSGNIQVSLAYRGKAENANVFLEAQEKYFGGK